MPPSPPAAPEPSAVPARPRVPLAPVLSAVSFRGVLERDHPERLPSVLDAGAVRLVTSGRIALALALREIGVGEGDSVLLPAYHSLSMIPPVLWRGATPRFYRVDAGARADLADIARLCDGHGEPAVKALVATHYFGFPQDLAALRALCDARGIALVEDCAHAFFGREAGRPLGATGDYAIASTMKFYPSYEGGALVSHRHSLDRIVLRSAGIGFEAKAALATLENGFAYGRLTVLHALLALPLAAKDWLWGRIKARRGDPASHAATGPATTAAAPPKLAPASSDSEAGFDPHWLDKRSSLFARLLLKRVPATRIVTLRRRRYLRLQAATNGLPGCRPLHERLPDGVCPWLFPLVVDDAEGAFARIRALGVPVTRFAEILWPGVDDTVCAHSAYLSRHVLAFPCHQELDDAEFAWLEARLAGVLAPSLDTVAA
jgi:perosamine synthetase